jgi:hypothetical protein
VCGALVLRPAKTEAATLRRIAAMVLSFLQLRELLRALPPLAAALAPADSALLRALAATAGAPTFSTLLATLDSLLDEDACSSRTAFLNRTQQCFALRAGLDPLLDVSRHAFCRATEQVHELAADLRQRHALTGLRVQYTARRGFYFVVGPAPQAGGGRGRGGGGGGDEDAGGGGGGRGGPPPRLPPEFSLLSAGGRAPQCTCDALNALNARLRDAGDDCLRLTEAQLDSASLEIQELYLASLHRLVDGLALADMLSGFALKLGASGAEFCRPALTAAGPLALVQLRHAVLEAADPDRPFQPNDAWLALDASLHVITGANMSGKSTYLRSVALAVVTAQVGCFVPARFASLAPCDALLARIGTSDSLETNASSFMVEMQVRGPRAPGCAAPAARLCAARADTAATAGQRGPVLLPPPPPSPHPATPELAGDHLPAAPRHPALSGAHRRAGAVHLHRRRPGHRLGGGRGAGGARRAHALRHPLCAAGRAGGDVPQLPGLALRGGRAARGAALLVEAGGGGQRGGALRAGAGGRGGFPRGGAAAGRRGGGR